MSLIKTAKRIVSYMHGIRERDIPYSVFLIARVLNDGNFTIVGYEMPEPFVLYETGSGKIPSKYSRYDNEVIFECAGSLEAGESIVMCSDGITQSGMGRGLAMGWTTEGLLKWMDRKIQSGKEHDETVRSAFNEALELSGGATDDMTIALLQCRRAKSLSLLTGPPAERIRDRDFSSGFLSGKGIKIVCGSSTMDMLSKITGNKIVLKDGGSFSKPPQYYMEGVDFAAEGAVTLNQIYNILDLDRAGFDEKSVVTSICEQIQDADIIRIFMGDASNTGHGSIVFRQTGILPRAVIVPLIVEKLLSKGKIVSVIAP
jgi:hypothetical protein